VSLKDAYMMSGLRMPSAVSEVRWSRQYPHLKSSLSMQNRRRETT